MREILKENVGLGESRLGCYLRYLKRLVLVGKVYLTPFILIALSACEESPRALTPFTPEYLAAHGIVPNQENTLRIFGTERITDLSLGVNWSKFPKEGVLFRFPAGMGLAPDTKQALYVPIEEGVISKLGSKAAIEQGKAKLLWRGITKGQADSVHFTLLGDKGFIPSKEVNRGRPIGDEVEVGIGVASDHRELQSKVEQIQQAPLVRAELALNLKKMVFPGEGNKKSTQIYYVPLSKQAAKKHPLFYIHCEYKDFPEKNYTIDAEPYYCASHYVTSNGLRIGYAFNPSYNLRRWQEMHQAVTQLIESNIVKK